MMRAFNKLRRAGGAWLRLHPVNATARRRVTLAVRIVLLSVAVSSMITLKAAAADGASPDEEDDDEIVSVLNEHPRLSPPPTAWLDSTVVARVGGEAVTAGDLYYALDHGREIDRSLPPDSLKELLLERTINQQLLVSEGYRRRYQLTDVVRAFANRTRESLAGDELRRRIYAGKIDIHEGELRELYERYYYTLRVRYLSVDRRDLAESILARLKAGEDFAAIARRYSEHRETAKNGGDMGEVKAGRMIIHFEDAVFPLEAGQLTEVIKGKGEHYKIFKVESKIRDREPPASFEEMREILARRVQTRKTGDALYAWQLSIFDRYGAEIDEETYEPFASALRERIAIWEAICSVHRDSLSRAWIFARWPRELADRPLVRWRDGGQLTVGEFNKQSRQSMQIPIALWRESDVQLRQFVLGSAFDDLHRLERQAIIDEKLPSIESEVERRAEDRMAKMVANTLVVSSEVITDEAAYAYWEGHKQEYKVPELARVRRIVVDTEGQARDILRRLDGGADFAALAERFSRDETTSHRGGETDFFGPGSMQGMADVALEHDPGERIPPFRSEAGWEIVEVLEKTPARPKTFDEVKAQVKSRLAQERTAEEVERAIAEARQRTAIEIDEAALERIALPS